MDQDAVAIPDLYLHSKIHSAAQATSVAQDVVEGWFYRERENGHITARLKVLIP